MAKKRVKKRIVLKDKPAEHPHHKYWLAGIVVFSILVVVGFLFVLSGSGETAGQATRISSGRGVPTAPVVQCPSNCQESWQGDNECDANLGCAGAECNFDGGDCNPKLPTVPKTTVPGFGGNSEVAGGDCSYPNPLNPKSHINDDGNLACISGKWNGCTSAGLTGTDLYCNGITWQKCDDDWENKRNSNKKAYCKSSKSFTGAKSYSWDLCSSSEVNSYHTIKLTSPTDGTVFISDVYQCDGTAWEEESLDFSNLGTIDIPCTTSNGKSGRCIDTENAVCTCLVYNQIIPGSQ
jgi:hypothetical protein